MKTKSLLDRIPQKLQERTRIQYGEGIQVTNGSLTYWMRNAARGHDNPALNTLIHSANITAKPPLVMHAITSVYPYASDRHHSFQLEGAIDVDRELTSKGIPYALYVEKRNDSVRYLKSMFEESSLVIIEEIPIKPFSVWGKILAKSTETPIISVDTDCIVPMKWPGQFYDRAYKFRNATQDEREHRIQNNWSAPELDTGNDLTQELPFEPVDTDSMDIPELIASCDIDHGVAPVSHSQGGSSNAYERWKTFREKKLDKYNRERNTPSKPNSVSRLSPYLHYGQVSPFKIAREASRYDSKGAQKFIDELITWRELAHHYCFHHQNYNCFNALPNWARKTLQDHSDDPREQTFEWSTLARGRTGDRLWDLCQKSLLTHGELHNNVRMTWAKQLLKWTPNPKKSLQMALDLNNRYALDGRDPNSYGGIFWCFGLFDKPYDQDRSIIGTVRPRSTDWHMKKVNLDSFSSYVHRPLTDESFEVAIVGAGIAGATACRILQNHQISVDCYEKSRGSGGRASTRRKTVKGNTYKFDHGAQYFTIHSMPFRRLIDSFIGRDDVAKWDADYVEINEKSIRQKTEQPDRYVAKPGMSSLTDHIFDDFEPEYSSRVDDIKNTKNQLRIVTDDEEITYDAVILTAPPKQSADLSETVSDSIPKACNKTHFLPTWAVMLGFDEHVPTNFDAAFVNHGKLDWIAQNSSKPGRPNNESWILHASPEWSKKNINKSSSDVTKALFQEWRKLIEESDVPSPVFRSAHRWRYARASSSRDSLSIVDSSNGLILSGDWLAGNRIEGAFLSGRSAASRVLNEVLDYRKYSQEKLFE